MSPIGLIFALPQELKAFGDFLVLRQENKFSDSLTFYEGTLEDKDVVWTICGIGKVNASVITALLKSEYKISTLIFSGVAGGIDENLHPGDIVIADKTIMHDYGHYENGFLTPHRSGINFISNPQHGQTHDFAASQKAHDITEQVIRNFTGADFQGRSVSLVAGTIFTGDVFMNDADKVKNLRETFHAQAIEMEGAAVMQAAELCGIKDVFIVRALSDCADGDSHTDFPALLHHAAPLAAGITRQIIRLV